MVEKVILISCAKTKRNTPSAAKDLYQSDLFRSMRCYAEENTDSWYILSAKHGVLQPDTIIEPYEKTLNQMTKPERMAWAEEVQKTVVDLIAPGGMVTMLAGERYRENLISFLEAHGHHVAVPMAGLPLGMQLRWLKTYGIPNTSRNAGRQNEAYRL